MLCNIGNGRVFIQTGVDVVQNRSKRMFRGGLILQIQDQVMDQVQQPAFGGEHLLRFIVRHRRFEFLPVIFVGIHGQNFRLCADRNATAGRIAERKIQQQGRGLGVGIVQQKFHHVPTPLRNGNDRIPPAVQNPAVGQGVACLAA